MNTVQITYQPNSNCVYLIYNNQHGCNLNGELHDKVLHVEQQIIDFGCENFDNMASFAIRTAMQVFPGHQITYQEL